MYFRELLIDWQTKLIIYTWCFGSFVIRAQIDFIKQIFFATYKIFQIKNFIKKCLSIIFLVVLFSQLQLDYKRLMWRFKNFLIYLITHFALFPLMIFCLLYYLSFFNIFFQTLRYLWMLSSLFFINSLCPWVCFYVLLPR